ncbi:hypothetical protein GEV33_003434 [Tenebrio molitor]|uniref:Uncharacterized protein n=1 Tax=Tenebrio molitor TaxID=7067 RepID=A0A8J6HS56_TENMO|nr:hypothetical protein GEV33_003434 [Tenebrio molitor]
MFVLDGGEKLKSSITRRLSHLKQITRNDVKTTLEPGDEWGLPAKRRRRPQSISSEDGRYRPQTSEGSFRSAGSGCAKLKRQNACRQKNRDVLLQENRQRPDQTVSAQLTDEKDESVRSNGPRRWRSLFICKWHFLHLD